ncbi:MAG: Maf family nucleotide pyrophosphatase [Bacteroidota bacterium]
MITIDTLNQFHLVLASQSPRRHTLLTQLGLKFDVLSLDIDESYPPELTAEAIPLYVCQQKSLAYPEADISPKTIVITADTIVWINETVLGKPDDAEDAKRMLRQLSGNKHEVITGVCLRSQHQSITFSINTGVWFKPLTDEEIELYVENFKPFDKAGAYAIQEWIGFIGIHRIEGSYFNVVGLPVQRLYTELLAFCEKENQKEGNLI